jgi:hypothetical protein
MPQGNFEMKILKNVYHQRGMEIGKKINFEI